MVAQEEVKRIRTGSQGYADDMEAVVRVFSERRMWNYDSKKPSTTMPRLLYRALGAEADHRTDWAEHPLRRHAAAEAASMYAQALADAANADLVRDWKEEALSLYRSVLESDDPRETPLLKQSARNNLGNVHFYLRDYPPNLATETNATGCPLSARNSPSPVRIRRCPFPKTPRKRGIFWDGRG